MRMKTFFISRAEHLTSFDTKARGNSEMAFYSGLTRTILLHCPIRAEIRTVDSQSDLRFFYSYD